MSQHHHDHASDHAMDFPEKALKLIDHWVKHNDDHGQSYRQWADTFRANGLDAPAALLDAAAELTHRINETLNSAREKID